MDVEDEWEWLETHGTKDDQEKGMGERADDKMEEIIKNEMDKIVMEGKDEYRAKDADE